MMETMILFSGACTSAVRLGQDLPEMGMSCKMEQRVNMELFCGLTIQLKLYRGPEPPPFVSGAQWV